MKILDVLYQNEEIVIINKPAGLATQGGKGILHSVDTVLEQQYGKKLHLVHRLDKDTAGILIVAKNPVAAKKYTQLIASDAVKKNYCALCIGKPSVKEGFITSEIEQNGKTKQAQTFFCCEKISKKELSHKQISIEQNFSKIFFTLKTGRMHQIRIHAAKNNFPLIGDDKYGNFADNKILAKTFGIKKLQLASFSLEIPINNHIKKFSIPLPAHMIEAETILF
ncbi:MAG: RluA family pseudouridine synthase [Treponemataceae bacterium]